MKRILVLSLFVAMLFIGCNFAKDSLKLAPDIEVSSVNPLAYYLPLTSGSATFTANFVAKNSIDAYLKGVVFTCTDANGSLIYGPTELLPIWLVIPGIVTPDTIPTASLIGVLIPRVDTVYTELVTRNLHSASVKIDFVFTDQYEMNLLDTASAWFGLYVE